MKLLQEHFKRLLMLLTAVAIVSCTTNPVTGKRQLSLMSESQEN